MFYPEECTDEGRNIRSRSAKWLGINLDARIKLNVASKPGEIERILCRLLQMYSRYFVLQAALNHG